MDSSYLKVLVNEKLVPYKILLEKKKKKLLWISM
jgi:hypothetical protein